MRKFKEVNWIIRVKGTGHFQGLGRMGARQRNYL